MATLVAVVFDGSSRSCVENGIQVNNAYIVCSKVLVNGLTAEVHISIDARHRQILQFLFGDVRQIDSSQVARVPEIFLVHVVVDLALRIFFKNGVAYEALLPCVIDEVLKTDVALPRVREDNS